ncbi:hypothetical protein G6L68_25125 [Agrobacterium fabrum]|uniref:hypothetical protein n=1 Tax=Agrobacterium fabrum TaxID=1176649 RepID=UPI000EF57C8A|nr:hypothetical protein [Agrobacterium fabrum]AYM66169.1 hypothetical protein At12D13_50170 [Agrobacterium fabrum]NTE63916.1 hypothetical protein [Agrobacterium fabrum]
METNHTFRIEVWDDPPDGGGSIIEVIASSSSFAVSSAALKVAIRERPGKYIVHMNGRNRMTCELAPDPPVPLSPPRALKVGPDPYPEELNDPKWTFASLPEWQTLAIHCRSCDRTAPVDRWEMARQHGKQTVITSLLPKLRCECKVRGDCEWKTGRLPR